ncbi:uncharacterized protein LOC130891946 [Diorhabda carinulata]|uniref:uncharacterized protein LOC130891946 n=1 Tax=Diorhabda carinulata TaxID=1163345 RepID=UPI0025A25C29|nr:uncharacterized protein LOC130891946 [Diorhabda carinulata]
MDLGFDLTLENPKEKAGVFAKLFFGWVVPLIKKGVKQGLQIEDLYKSSKKDKSQNLTDALQVYWEDEVRKSQEKKTKPNLMKALFKQFYKEAFIYGFMWFYTNVIIVCLRPIILAELIKLFADKNVADNYEIYVYSVALIIVSFLSTITLHHVIFAMQAIGMRVRIATSSLVYRKVTRLSQRSLGETPAGKVVNILSNDLSRFDLVFPVIHALWVMPFQVLVIFLIIWQQVGLAAVTGVATMVVVTVPIQGFLTKYVANLRDSVSKKTDRRVKIMSEIVSGMQVIKMYAWEKPFEKLVKTTRTKEMKDVNSASILRGIYSSSTVFSDKLSVFTTLLTYVLLGNIISADKVFSIAQSFGILQLAMAVVYPLAISTGAEALVSIKRLEDFLTLEEKEEEEDIVRAPRNTGITVSYADASWTDTGCTLEDINLRIPPGTLCAVVGPVGAGKSSLLQLLIGELAALSGGIEIGGEISYSAQQPWLFQSSVRNNILFGSHYDKNLYKRVVEVCALRNDFDQLPHGDRTIVGEKGVSLSGGQRARINLARAVYRKADIYLLDDPLSAVDTHVGKHLFDECVCEFLKGKTRILVTHQLQYLKKADMIIVLNGGVVEAQGTFDELSEYNLDFTKMVIAADETDESSEDTNPPSSEATETFFPIPEEEVRRFSMSSSTKMSLLSISDSEESETTDKITEEKSGDGPNSKPFKNYLKSVKNNTLVVFVIILLLSSQALIIGVDQWLTLWTSEEQIRHSNCTVFIQPNTHPNITNVTIDFIENNHFDGTSLINHGTFHKNNYPTHRNINNSHYYYYRNNDNNENDENTPDKKEETTNNDNNIINNTNNDENGVEKHNDDFPYNENDLNDEHKYFDGSTVHKKSFFNNSNDDIKDNESFINKNDDSTIHYNHLSNDRGNSTRIRRNSFDIGSEPGFYSINNGSTESWNNYLKGFDNDVDIIKKEDESIKKLEDFNKIHENGTRNDKGSSSINGGTTNNPRINYFDNVNKNLNKENESTKDNMNFFKNYIDSTSTEPDFYNFNIGSTKSVKNLKKNIDDIDNKYDFIKKEDESIKKLEDFNKIHENGTSNDEGLSSINTGTTNNPPFNYFDKDNKNLNKENGSIKDNGDFFKKYVDSTSTEPDFYNFNIGSTKSVKNLKKNIDDIDNKYDFIKKEDESIKKLGDFNKIHENGTRNDEDSSSINSGTTNNPRINYFDNVNKNFNKEDESTKDNGDFFRNYIDSTNTEPNFYNINNGSTQIENNLKKYIDDIDNKYDFIKKEDESIKKLEDFNKIHENGTRNDEGSSSINSGTTNNPRINYFHKDNKNLNKENESTKDNMNFFKNYIDSTSTEPDFYNFNIGSTKSVKNLKKNIDDIDNKYDFIKKEDESIKKLEDFNKIHGNGTRNDEDSSSINSGTTNNPRINYFDNVNKNFNKEDESTKDNGDYFRNYIGSTSKEPDFYNFNNGSTKMENNLKKNIDDIGNKYDFIKKEDESDEDFNKNHENGTRNDEVSSIINGGATNNPRINYFDKDNKNLNKENESTKDNEDFSKNYVDSTSTEPNFYNIDNGSTKNVKNLKKNIDDIDNKYDFIKKEDESNKNLEDFDKIHENGTRNDEGSSSINSGTTNNQRINYFDKDNKNLNKENESTKDNEDFFRNYIDSTNTEPNFYNINNGSTQIENNLKKYIDDIDNKHDFIKKEDESIKKLEDFNKIHENGTRNDGGSSSINGGTTNNPRINYFDNVNKNFNKENESTKDNMNFFKNYVDSTSTEPNSYIINNGSTKIENNWEKSNNDFNNKYNFTKKEDESIKNIEDFTKNHKNGANSEDSSYSINISSTKNPKYNHFNTFNNNFTKENESTKDDKKIFKNNGYSTSSEPSFYNINNSSTINKNNYHSNKNENTKYSEDFFKNHKNGTSTIINNGSTKNDNNHYDNKNEKNIKYSDDFSKNKVNGSRNENNDDGTTKNENNYYNNKENEDTKHNDDFIKNHMNSTNSEPSYYHKNGSTLNNSLHFSNKEDGGTKYREDLFKNDYNSTINNKFNNKANEGTKYLKNHMNSTSTEPSYSKNGNSHFNNSNKPIIDMFDNQKSTNNSFSNLINSTDNSTENIIKKIMKKLNIRNILSFITLNFNNMYDYVIIDGSIQRLIKTDSALYIYGTLIILVVLLVLSRTFLYYMSCTMASENLHSIMFNKLLKAPMRFFDTNPSGRILNRFSKDIGCIDEILPRVLLDSVSIFLVMAGILINIVIANPIMIIILIILGSLYLKFRKWYMATAKTLKHLEGIAKSPVFSHVSSTICGIVTIRSSHSEEILINEFDRHQDVHTSAWYLTLACMNAFGLWLDLIVLIFLAIVTFSFVITASFTNVNGSMAGLAISQCMVLTGMLQYGMKQLAEVINNLTSVERVLQYTTLDNEGPFDTPKEKKPKGTWPRRGNIEFNNLYLKYVENEPPVLKNLNMIFKPGEKIGIVGRTGAGKSSLISALFRLAPLEGSILIDRVEIQNLGLTDLRKKISIIPQEPVLFSETLRYNLDPFGEFDDDKIWDALELVELKESVDSLDFMVAEGGANFSLGQRQLICLARAILKDNKILILDEATANVDQRTDSLIQATIRKAFKDCTVLTIAHRLNTIMDSDKVLVMSFGNMVEFDHPHNLLQIEDGYFHKLVMETSPTMAQELKNTAQKAYQKYITEND